MDLLSSVLGFAASLVLFYPGWRASQYLKLIQGVKEATLTAKQAGGQNDPGELLVEALEDKNSSWSARDHNLLMLGFILLCGSFFFGLLSKL